MSTASTGVICAAFFMAGVCSKEATCPFEHAVPVCIHCKQKFATITSYELHIKKQEHIERVKGAERRYRCSLCTQTVDAAEWKSHISGHVHLTKARSQNVNPDEITPEEIKTSTTEHQYCSACDAHVPVRGWSTHENSPRHLRSVQFSRFISAIEASAKDRNGVAVSKDGDFGTVELPEASLGVKKTFTIKAEATSEIRLIRSAIATSSNEGSALKRSSIFSLETSSDGVYGSEVSVSVTARTSHPGRFNDRLELLFEGTAGTSTRFLIIRLLSITVGSSADLDSIKPTSPYKAAKKQRRKAATEIIEPGLISESPFLSGEIKYLKPLPFALIPDYLNQILSDESQPTARTIARIRDRHLPAQFSLGTYAEHFRHILWLEEFQTELNLERYDMSSVTLRKDGKRLFLAIAGLAEKRPSVLLGDTLLAQPVGEDEGKWFSGRVHEVRLDEVALGFHESLYTAGKRFNIRFKLNRTPMRRQHQAMYEAFVQARILFPDQIHVLSNEYPRPADINLQLYDTNIASNPSQRQAVTSIVERAPGSVPFILFGPPGTGKTTVVVESIRQTLKRWPESRILACAPSNAAADLIAERLAPYLSSKELFRAYGPSRGRSQVPVSLLGHICVSSRTGTFSVHPLEVMEDFRVIVSTCVSASIFPGIGMPRGHFTHIFLDEAAQATEPEAMISIRLLASKETNIVLSGDPKQLGPVIHSRIAVEFGMGMSYLERLIARPIYEELEGYGTTVVKLVKSFRSHSAILHFPNERFYGGDLEACADPNVVNAYLGTRHLVNPKFPIVFHSISGKDNREASSPSYFNVDEAGMVKEAVVKLLTDTKIRTVGKDIGVIAPYHAQCQKIRKLLKTVVGADEVTVGSVEQFQGQERRVIIISTVRSSQELVEFDLRHTLGFVANPRRFNVAVTRAKALLMIIGDPTVLSLDPLWRRFLNYVYLNTGWKGPPPTWDTQADVDDAGGYDAAIRAEAEEDMNELTRRIEMLTMTAVGGSGSE